MQRKNDACHIHIEVLKLVLFEQDGLQVVTDTKFDFKGLDMEVKYQSHHII